MNLIESHFEIYIAKDSKIKNAHLLVHSDKLGIHLNLAGGNAKDEIINPDQPYFMASVGKLFTSVLFGILYEKRKLDYNDKINKFIPPDIMKDLHVYKGKDYSNDIKIKHLLNHTSGLHDYFDDKPKNTKPFIDIILEEKDRMWSPVKVIAWSKNNLKPHFPPGKGFHYSDTGYQLLGLIIEKLCGMPFHEALREHIFKPLNMNNSFLLHHSEPTEKSEFPVAGVYMGEKNVINHKSLSVDYAGGGIVSTSEDMLLFLQSIVKGKIISESTFKIMQDWAGFFNIQFMGIDYGYGLMKFKAIPLFLPEKYSIWGNAGSTGAFMFYNPRYDTYCIGTLNQFRYHSKGVRMVFKNLAIIAKGNINY